MNTKDIPELIEAENRVRDELLDTVYDVVEEEDQPCTR